MTGTLFSNTDLYSRLTQQDQRFANEITALDEHRILNTSPDDLHKYIVDKYRFNPVAVDESATTMDYGDAQVDVSHRLQYALFDMAGPHYVTGTRVTFYIPFTGDSQLLTYRPSTFNHNPPKASIDGDQLLFIYNLAASDLSTVGNSFEQDKANLNKYLEWSMRDITQFNSRMVETVSQHITNRREKIMQDRGLVEKLGFPLRRRDSVPATFVSPNVKRRTYSQLPPVSKEPYLSEPTLDNKEYEYILKIIADMVLVMEQSPSAFKGMKEEDLRTQILVPLNGHYEGKATGETFNYEGKTDILIRDRGKNIFIAECKFWSGPSGLTDALDQLLSYTSWRDTKTALLVFNRERQMSTVLEKIPGTVRQHPNYKRDRPVNVETGFRYIFGHRDDLNREITLTVLVFDVPV